jgi:hypothetical protein
MDLAAGLEPELSAQVLRNENLPLLGKLGYGHMFLPHREKSVPGAKNVGKREWKSLSAKFMQCVQQS